MKDILSKIVYFLIIIIALSGYINSPTALIIGFICPCRIFSDQRRREELRDRSLKQIYVSSGKTKILQIPDMPTNCQQFPTFKIITFQD